eukprot:gb/GECG01003221.1/.p1 GENE.gb/GECG01003221.1/~~gb/GECG01003221.1/.p1  ORF type:complete len:203 (+),score=23.15 gb/GECG01003221.1/:1-609(+)
MRYRTSNAGETHSVNNTASEQTTGRGAPLPGDNKASGPPRIYGFGARGQQTARAPPSNPSTAQKMSNRSKERRALFGTNNTNSNGSSGWGQSGHDSSSNSASVRSNEETNRIFEEDNNRMLSDLENKVTQLKNVTTQVSSEVAEHNRLLDGMSDNMGQTEGMLGSTMRSLDGLLNSGAQSHMCILVMFVVGAFLLVYWLFIR